MSESQTNGNGGAKIYKQICAIMQEVDCISKSRQNAQQGYRFRGIDEVYNYMHPLLAKHSVFVFPNVLDRQVVERQTQKGGTLFYTTLTVRHTFATDDGSSIDVVTIGEAMDSADKSSNKAMSAAMKYALIETFAIPTEGDNDADATTPDQVVPQGNGRSQPAAPVAPPAKATPEQVTQLLGLYERKGIIAEDQAKALKAFKVNKAMDLAATDIAKLIARLESKPDAAPKAPPPPQTPPPAADPTEPPPLSPPPAEPSAPPAPEADGSASLDVLQFLSDVTVKNITTKTLADWLSWAEVVTKDAADKMTHAQLTDPALWEKVDGERMNQLIETLAKTPKQAKKAK